MILGMILPTPSVLGFLSWKAAPFVLIYHQRDRTFKIRYALAFIACLLYASYSTFIGKVDILSSAGITVSALLVLLSHDQGKSLISKSQLKPILLMVGFLYIFYIIIDSNFIRPRSDGRIHLFHIDPNFSSVVLFGAYALTRSRSRNMASVIVLTLGLVLQSRAFILSLVIFEVFRMFPLVKKIRVASPICISTGLVLLLSSTISGFLGDFNIQQEGARLINWSDNSNIGRFQKFSVVWQMLQNGDLTFHGISIETFGSIVPHNTALYTIATYGVIQSLLFLILFNGLKAENVDSVAFVLGYITFSTFLHGLLLGFFLCFFLIILNELKNYDINCNTPQKYR